MKLTIDIYNEMVEALESHWDSKSEFKRGYLSAMIKTYLKDNEVTNEQIIEAILDLLDTELIIL